MEGDLLKQKRAKWLMITGGIGLVFGVVISTATLLNLYSKVNSCLDSNIDCSTSKHGLILNVSQVIIYVSIAMVLAGFLMAESAKKQIRDRSTKTKSRDR